MGLSVPTQLRNATFTVDQNGALQIQGDPDIKCPDTGPFVERNAQRLDTNTL